MFTRYEIKAPFDGVFTTVNREVGSIASLSTEIANIVSTDVLEITVGVFLQDAQNLAIGTKVEIASKSGNKYIGTVNRIASFIDPSTQRVNVYITFTEPKLEIIEGEMLMVKMPSQTIQNAVAVVREAVVGDSVVYTVKEDNTIRAKKINLIMQTENLSYIKGLTDGDRYVNESIVSPYEGMEILPLDMNGNPL